MARRNSIGANANKTASTYQATAPDGTVFKKKSFCVHSATAFIGAYQHNGIWYVSGVSDRIQNWGTQIFLEATKIK